MTYSEHCKATEKGSNTGKPGKDIWRKKYGQWASRTGRERRRWQHKKELGEDKRPVVYAPLEAPRHKSVSQKHI